MLVQQLLKNRVKEGFEARNVCTAVFLSRLAFWIPAKGMPG